MKVKWLVELLEMVDDEAEVNLRVLGEDFSFTIIEDLEVIFRNDGSVMIAEATVN